MVLQKHFIPALSYWHFQYQSLMPTTISCTYCIWIHINTCARSKFSGKYCCFYLTLYLKVQTGPSEIGDLMLRLRRWAFLYQIVLARIWYLWHGWEIAPHGDMWYVIMYPHWGYLLLGLNSLPPADSIRPRKSGSGYGQEMDCRLFGAKPLPEPKLIYCQLDP